MSWKFIFLQVAFIAQVKKYELILFIKRNKKDKKVALQLALRFVINISCFDEEARGCTFQFVEILSKNEYFKRGN